jgi:bifunctional DNA-binding transcriptional regulator/antitoxin component of YhaV-PrlF toxin-antitoxin module
MGVTFSTVVIPDGNHASLAIPDSVLAELKTNRRAPLRVTINGHTYQSTATGVGGECRVVFPSADRKASGATGGDTVTVTLELDDGYRAVDIHPEFAVALDSAGVRDTFNAMRYSLRKELARGVSEAKTDETRSRRVQKALDDLRSLTIDKTTAQKNEGKR